MITATKASRGTSDTIRPIFGPILFSTKSGEAHPTCSVAFATPKVPPKLEFVKHFRSLTGVLGLRNQTSALERIELCESGFDFIARRK